jgi:hypothetical protein
MRSGPSMQVVIEIGIAFERDEDQNPDVDVEIRVGVQALLCPADQVVGHARHSSHVGRRFCMG